jgi:hypothetical protein
MTEKHLNNSFLKIVRWRILVTLEAARPNNVSEHLIIQVLNDSECATLPFSIRRELDFLELLQLIKIENKKKSPWIVSLTAEGMKVVQGLADAPEGIARPEWE